MTVLKREKDDHEGACDCRIVRCTSECELSMPYKNLDRHQCVVELKKNLIGTLQLIIHAIILVTGHSLYSENLKNGQKHSLP